MKRYYEIRDRSDAHFYSIFDRRYSNEPVARVHVDLLDKVLAALNGPKPSPTINWQPHEFRTLFPNGVTRFECVSCGLGEDDPIHQKAHGPALDPYGLR